MFRRSQLQPTTKVDENGPYRSYIEKGADTALASDLVACAARDEFDVAVIVSSDGDFAPAVEQAISGFGKRVEVVYFKGRRPLVMDNLANMREFRQSLLKELDKPRKSRKSNKSSGM